MDISIHAKGVGVSGDSYSKVIVELKGVSKSDLLEKFSHKDIAAHFDHETLLNAIGVEVAKEHFGLTEQE